MSRIKGLYHPFGSSPLYSDDKIYKTMYLEREKSLWSCWSYLNAYSSLRFTLILWLTHGPSTLTCVHLWLWWLLFYGMYCLLKTIGPCIVIITLCFGPFDPLMILVYPLYVIHLMLDLWPFTLWLLPLISYVLILLIKSLWFINKDLWTIKSYVIITF